MKERELVYDFPNLKYWEVFNREDLKDCYKDYPARIIGYDYFKVETPKEFYFKDDKSSILITEDMEKPISLLEYQELKKKAREKGKKMSLKWLADKKSNSVVDLERDIKEAEIKMTATTQREARLELFGIARANGYKRHSWHQQGPCSNWGTVLYKEKKMFQAYELDWVDDLKRFKEFLEQN